jgi:polyhydroxyalkanoate synthesis regulator phasin
VTPSTVRDKLKAALNITGLRVFDTIPDNIIPPAAIVGQLSFDYDLVFQRGADSATCDVLVVTGRMSERAAQDYLDNLLQPTGNSSVKTKIESDQTLGGSVTSVRVSRAEPVSVTSSGVEMLAYRFQVNLWG